MAEEQPGQKNVSKAPISTNKPGMLVHACNPTYVKVIGRRTKVSVKPRQKA
jgi:hypothetical protein